MPIITHLRIDTSIASAGPSSSRTHSSRDGLTAGPLRTPSSARSTDSNPRIRTLSSTSSASSSAVSAVSTTSRAPSSASHLSAHTARRSIPTTPTSPEPEGLSRPGPSPAWHTIDSGSEDEAIGNADEYVLAMHDFSPQQPNVTCLSFRAGQVIHVLNRDSSGWWDGELEGRRGWFPSNYVTSEVGLLTDEELPGKKVCPHVCLSLLALVSFNRFRRIAAQLFSSSVRLDSLFPVSVSESIACVRWAPVIGSL